MRRTRQALASFAIAGAVLLLAIANSANAPATERPQATTPAFAVIDGDTLERRATGERIRLVNADTPEHGEQASCLAERRLAARATAHVRDLLAEAERVDVREVGRTDTYGRTLARVALDGRDLGETLIAEGLAHPWRDHREPWCGNTRSIAARPSLQG